LAREKVAKQNGNLYQEDYAAIRLLQQLASEYQIAIVGVHHLRKMESDDPLDMVSGSTGTTGAADTLAILSRIRGQNDGALFVTGRDIEEDVNVAMEFDHSTGQWTIVGDAEEHAQSDERKAVLEVLRDASGDGSWLQPKQIADLLGIEGDQSGLRHLLTRLAKNTNLVEHKLGGGYRIRKEDDDRIVDEPTDT